MACRYAVQYEDGDKEEFVASELTKGGKKSMLQPPGVEDKSDYEELDRLYVQAQTEWAAGKHSIFECISGCPRQTFALLLIAAMHRRIGLESLLRDDITDHLAKCCSETVQRTLTPCTSSLFL